MRTPKEIIDLALKKMGSCGHVVNKVDKQAYLSAYALANYIIVTCDSTSMISEAATSGKPIFVAHMKPKKDNYRFRRFFELFKQMGITRDLGEKVETWTYNKHNEAQRIAAEIKSKIKHIEILDGRKNSDIINLLFKKGYDIDKGAILLKDSDIFHGAEAINTICKQIESPSSNLLKFLSSLFKSNNRTRIIFPLLIRARRFALIAKGVSTSLI